uniref:hypothetical protein n=1 Tax=Bacteroides fragilis TaxID=817 RepID=UPI003566B27C
MKKLNVQRDLDSRARMAETTLLPVLPNPIVEPVKTEPDAESQRSIGFQYRKYNHMIRKESNKVYCILGTYCVF